MDNSPKSKFSPAFLKNLAHIQPLNNPNNPNQPSANSHWLKIAYERNEYIIDLSCIKSFCREPNGRITFWLPDSSIPIIINPNSDPETYKVLLKYIETTTGYKF